MFGPQVVLDPWNGGMFSVRKLTLTGWKYLDVWNYKTWHKFRGERSSPLLWQRCCASKGRAEMALLFYKNPPPF